MISTLILAVCSWSNPGHNPYMGEVPAAVDSYKDIPADVRQRLKARMQVRKYDDLAVIRRDSIEGYDTSYTELRAMHFGKGTVCNTVSRDKWSAKHEEVGLIYCESEHCLIVPTVCRNVSRVTKVSKPVAVLPPVNLVDHPAPTPPGGYFADPIEKEFIYASQTAFSTSSPWLFRGADSFVGASPAPQLFFVVVPSDVPNPPPNGAPVVQNPPTNPVSPPRFPSPPPSAPVVNPPVATPWTPEPPVSPPVPEPSTWALILTGLVALTLRKNS